MPEIPSDRCPFPRPSGAVSTIDLHEWTAVGVPGDEVFGSSVIYFCKWCLARMNGIDVDHWRAQVMRLSSTALTG